MTQPLYHLRNVLCQYKGRSHPVLQIERLDIAAGAIVFLVGSSGVGKSTALELMGLMNNTLVSKPDGRFEFCIDGLKDDLGELMVQGGRRLSDFRRRHLSFIFQTTNLMPTMTALENVTVAASLHGASPDSAAGKAYELFGKILRKRRINAGTRVTELSGGEKQRLAFARAISTEFTVLLADEPTGNLDWGNAKLLMDFLCQEVRRQGKTAIIVSHDVRLATRYGDRIVYIEGRRGLANDELYRYGVICEALTFRRDEVLASGANGWVCGAKRLDTEDLIEDLHKRLEREARDED